MKWHPSALGVLGSLGALLAGCSVGPAYHRPDIAPPAQWHETAGGASAILWPAADWWHGFGSAKLDELISEAERNNDDLAGAIARVQEADDGAGQIVVVALGLGYQFIELRRPEPMPPIGGRPKDGRGAAGRLVPLRRRGDVRTMVG